MARYRIVFKGDGCLERSSGYLAHFGIKGMKWGVRRFQDANGHLTEEGKKRYASGADELKKEAGDIKKFGKEYDQKVKAGLYDNDPELRELYVMERMESRKLTKDLTKNNSASESMKKAVRNLPKGATEQERKMLEKAANGGDLSEKEYKALLKMGTDHHEKAFKLRDELAKTTDPQKKAQLQKQLEEEAQAADYGYDEAAGLARMNKYAKEIASETDSKYIDPSYRKFNSKEEKARAEEKYLEDTWYNENNLTDEERSKYERECQHLSDRVWFLSMNGYAGIPVSERNRAMFDVNKRDYTYHVTRDYEDFKPKYEKSPEYQALQQKREKIAEETGYKAAKDAVYNEKVSDALSPKQQQKVREKAWDAYNKARRKYSDAIEKSGIKEAERKMEDQFNKQICKNVLLDLGYEVTPKNLQLIEGIIWYD